MLRVRFTFRRFVGEMNLKSVLFDNDDFFFLGVIQVKELAVGQTL